MVLDVAQVKDQLKIGEDQFKICQRTLRSLKLFRKLKGFVVLAAA